MVFEALRLCLSVYALGAIISFAVAGIIQLVSRVLDLAERHARKK